MLWWFITIFLCPNKPWAVECGPVRLLVFDNDSWLFFRDIEALLFFTINKVFQKRGSSILVLDTVRKYRTLLIGVW